VTRAMSGNGGCRARDRLAGFPGNPVFLRAAERGPGPLPEVTEPHHRSGGRAEEWPTLICQGSNQYDELLRLAREIVGPQADLLYAAGDQVAILVGGVDADVTDPADLVARLQRAVDQLGLQVEVRFERYPYRRHCCVVPSLCASGHDHSNATLVKW
jgi:hypothetical protein